MSSQTSSAQPLPLTEEQVAEYLRTHPEFFDNRHALLEQLRLPHHVSGAVSLIERQIRVLRTKNHQLERKFLSLVKAAKANETLSSRMHQLAIALVSAGGLEEVIHTAESTLTQAFQADSARVKLLDDENREETLDLFSDAYASNRPVCGTLTEKQKTFVFGTEVSNIQSAVLVPLSHGQPEGYLALGSHDANRFHAGMGTLFLGYLGELVTAAILAHQDTSTS